MANKLSLRQIMAYAPDINSPWNGKYKIPWDEPEFSRRMLKEHLAQEHDMASRRASYIREHTDWIDEVICQSKPAKILDLGCGPGLYLKNLAGSGHTGKGIDFSPASIEHARSEIKQGFELVCEDIREAEFGSGYDLVYMIYGEFNVFSPDEIAAILDKAYTALKIGGTLLIEPYNFDSVKRIGEAQDSWYKMPSGLFSDKPHICLIDNHWNDEQAVSLQYFHIIEVETGELRQYRSTTKAWTLDEYHQLLAKAGFKDITEDDDWLSYNNDFFLIRAGK